MPTFWLARRDGRLHRDVLAAERSGQPVGTKPQEPRRHGPRPFRPARPAPAAQGADRGVAGHPVRHRGAPADRHDLRRPRPLRDDGVAGCPQHAPVPAGRADLRPQRRGRGSRRHRRPAARARHPGSGVGPDRFGAGVRVDHRCDPSPRRRRDGRTRRRRAVARDQRAHLRGQRLAEHGHRHVGAALPAVARALSAGPPRRPRRGFRPVHPAESAPSRSIRASARRWCSPANRWTTTRVGRCSNRGNWSTWTPGCGSAAASCYPTRQRICCATKTSARRCSGPSTPRSRVVT